MKDITEKHNTELDKLWQAGFMELSEELKGSRIKALENIRIMNGE